MIIGKSKAVRQAEEQAKILAMMQGVRQFAWWPTKLESGHTVWLQYYFAYYRGGKNDNGYFLWSSSPEEYAPMCKNYLTRDPKQFSCTPIK